MPILLCSFLGWFQATAEELSSSHRPLTKKFRILLSGPWQKKFANFCSRWYSPAHTEVSRDLEHIFFPLLPSGPTFSPWAGISLARLAFIVILVVLFGEDLAGTRMREWDGEEMEQGEWVLAILGLGLLCPVPKIPSCGGLVNDADRLIPVAFCPGHLRRVISI